MKKIVSAFLVTVILVGTFVVAFDVRPAKASGTIYIRADGSIDPSTANITTIDGSTYAFADNIANNEIVVERDNIVIDGAGYTLQGTGSGAGIWLSGRSNVTIKNMEIRAFQRGIRVDDSSDNTVSDNTVTNNEYGIVLYHSSSRNTLRNNDASDNRYNLGVFTDSVSGFIQDIDDSNTVNGKPVYYWVNRRDLTVPRDAGYVVLVNCTRITVRNLSLANNMQGIALAFTTNSIITHNSMTSNFDGIRLDYSSNNNMISGNNITANTNYGIRFFCEGSAKSMSPSNNTVYGNNITSNQDGIRLDYPSNNNISANNVAYNHYGIGLYGSSGSNNISGNNLTANSDFDIWFYSSYNDRIYHNNFLSHSRHVYPAFELNIWDAGYPSGGNYWSDYAGIDVYSGPRQDEAGSDRIGDTPYFQDNYPLMSPWVPFQNQTVYIRADGSIDPPTSPISSVDNATYIMTGNIASDADGIVVQRDNIIIDGAGYTIQRTGAHVLYPNGISLVKGNNVTIKNTRIEGFFLGIYLNSTSHIGIVGNNITDNCNGIDLGFSSNNVICGNYITNNDNRGILLVYSSDNALNGNNVTSNFEGISIIYSPNNYLANNTLAGNARNFGVLGETKDDFLQNIETSNTVEGKPICYWINRTAQVVPINAGYVAIVDSRDVRVEGLDISHNLQGILLAYSANSTVKDNKLADNLYGVYLVGGETNKVTNNNITNSDYGVGLRYSTLNNLSGNTFSENTRGMLLIYSSNNNSITQNVFTEGSIGIDLVSADFNSISQNNFTRNQQGIMIDSSFDNLIYHNRFVDNYHQVYVYSQSACIWDSGYPSGGNYWSDYVGVDIRSGPNQDLPRSDGIGDTPYVIDGDNQDNYPIMAGPETPREPGDVNSDGVVNISDIVLATASYGSMQGGPAWNPDADQARPYGIIDIFDLVTIASNYGKT